MRGSRGVAKPGVLTVLLWAATYLVAVLVRHYGFGVAWHHSFMWKGFISFVVFVVVSYLALWLLLWRAR